MIVLSVDTSGTTGSLALAEWDGGFKWRHQNTWTKKAMHSELATVELQSLLDRAGRSLADITHLIVNHGPGSFTGLRVGLSLTKTLAYTLAIPVWTVGTLELIAQTQGRPGEKIFVALKAVQNFFYVAAFELDADGVPTEILPPQSAADSELARLSASCTKTLIEEQTAGFTPKTEAKDGLDLLALKRFKSAKEDWKSVEPLYIRGSEAEEKLKRGLLKPL